MKRLAKSRRSTQDKSDTTAFSRSVDLYKISSRSTKGFRMIHLLGLCRRHDELARRGRSRYVRIIVDTFPQQRSKSLGTFTPEILMLEPVLAPPPAAAE